MPQKKTEKVTCKSCGVEFYARKADLKRGRAKCCSRSCANRYYGNASVLRQGSMEANPNWKGGLHKSLKGYWYVKYPEHPRAMKNGYVKRADLVLERKLGRALTQGEIAHHIDEDKENDSPDNLVPMTFSEHTKHHRCNK